MSPRSRGSLLLACSCAALVAACGGSPGGRDGTGTPPDTPGPDLPAQDLALPDPGDGDRDPGPAGDVPSIDAPTPPQDGGDASAAADAVPDGEADPGSVDAAPGDPGIGDAPSPDVPDVPPLPQGCLTGEFQAFFGNLHAHSTFSDGAGSPAEAFAYARDTAHLDFQFMTDHLEQLYYIPCLAPNQGWPDCNQAADAATGPAFVAACGFEYGTSIGGLTGHNNAYYTPGLFPCLQLYFTQFYESVKACPDCIAQFNHPGSALTHNWKHFEYDPDVDPKMNLIELSGDGPAFEMFSEALDAGWHLSPVFDQDNHGADWGTQNDGRAGFWLPALTREAIHDAMRLGRSFATTDRNATITLRTAEGCWMGSRLKTPGAVTVTAEAKDPDEGDGFVRMELWGPKARTLSTVECGGTATCSASLGLDGATPTYVFARAIQADGQYLVSAPIWVE